MFGITLPFCAMSSSKNPVWMDQCTTTKLWLEDVGACATSECHLPRGISPTCICSSDNLCEVSFSHWFAIPARARAGNTGSTLDSSPTSSFSGWGTTSKRHRNLKGFNISLVILDSALHFTLPRVKKPRLLLLSSLNCGRGRRSDCGVCVDASRDNCQVFTYTQMQKQLRPFWLSYNSAEIRRCYFWLSYNSVEIRRCFLRECTHSGITLCHNMT